MSIGFWFSLFCAVVAFVPCILGHRKALAAVRSTTGNERRENEFWLAWLWIAPALPLIGMVFTGIDSIDAMRKESIQTKFNSQQSNRIARAENKLLPRWTRFDVQRFSDGLQGAVEKMRVELVYLKDDEDSYALCLEMKHVLEANGWPVIGPRIMSEADAMRNDQNEPLTFRTGTAHGGVTIRVKKLGKPSMKSPQAVLQHAFSWAWGGTSSAWFFLEDHSMPDDLMRFVIGIDKELPKWAPPL